MYMSPAIHTPVAMLGATVNTSTAICTFRMSLTAQTPPYINSFNARHPRHTLVQSTAVSQMFISSWLSPVSATIPVSTLSFKHTILYTKKITSTFSIQTCRLPCAFYNASSQFRKFQTFTFSIHNHIEFHHSRHTRATLH